MADTLTKAETYNVEGRTSPVSEVIPQNVEDQRWLESKDWVGVLKMMDVLDEATGSDAINYPHLNMVHWYWYHMPNQGISAPFPNRDGTESESQRQIVASVDWILRLGKEIDPKIILEFPSIDGKSNNQSTDTFLNRENPDYSNAVSEVSELLEPKAKDGNGLGFGLTEENYTKLDSPRKKIVAFLLLRERVSNLMAGVISDILYSLGHKGEISNIHDLLTTANDNDNIRLATKAFLKTKLGGKSTIDWLASVYNNPLLTHTGDVYFSNGNSVRKKFEEEFVKSPHA